MQVLMCGMPLCDDVLVGCYTVVASDTKDFTVKFGPYVLNRKCPGEYAYTVGILA